MKWKVGGACGTAMRWLASKLLRQPQRSGARSTFTLWATGPMMRASSSSSPQDAYPDYAGPHDYTRAVLNAEPPPFERRRARPGGPVSSFAISCFAALVALGLVPGVSAETWRGLTVAPEHHCAPYDKRRDYPYPQSVELSADRASGLGCCVLIVPGVALRDSLTGQRADDDRNAEEHHHDSR